MKILELEIKNIRGIKHINIKPEGKSVVIFGPNGTGKSAIVDAVDFLFSGRIARLTGEGTQCLGLKEHGCHVDFRDDLKKTVVYARVEIGDKKVTLERSINKPASLKVEPKDCEDLVHSYLAVAELGQHILSRREILKYITAEAGKRAKEIQSLLDLMDIENLRAMLVSIKNESESNYKHEESDFEIAKSEVAKLLSIPTFSEEGSLKKVNELRSVLKGTSIAELTPEKVKENLTPHLFEAKRDVLTKDQIENNIKEFKELIKLKDEVAGKETELVALLEEVKKEAKLKQYSVYKKLFEAGISLAGDSNICPLCGRAWEDGDFKVYLEEKKQETDVAKEKQGKIDEVSVLIKTKMELLKNDISNLVKAKAQFGIKASDDGSLVNFLGLIDSWSSAMLAPLECFEKEKWPVRGIEYIFDTTFMEAEFFAPLEIALKKVGDQLSKQQLAWDTLTKMEDKWRTYRGSVKDKLSADLYRKRAEASLDHFEQARNSVLEGIYDAVKANFDKYYQTVHSEDESKFISKISHEGASLNFEVDFYGRGMFPPHALHSEGHQDSMGLCLFFALNEYLTKDAIRTIVLDDVVMSIDRNHRRDICRLLNKFFTDKQFIITTHDTAWAKQLRTEGVVTQTNMIHFVNWNIDTGPVFEMDKDLWAKIKECLDKDDVPGAAHKLRREAECFFENVCDFLNAKVPYKGHHQWELGDFVPAATIAFKQYLKKAKDNFSKMSQQDKVDLLTQLEKSAGEIIIKSQAEQWAINAQVHYDRWGEFGKKEFQPVVDAFKELFNLFTCSKCGSLLSLSQDKGSGGKVSVSCNCGDVFWNVQ